MYFTQDDYRRIERWLGTRTVKDTQFPKADPFKGSEIVPIVQDGKNKAVTLNTFLKELSLMKLPDFFNVTTFTCRSNLTLKEAISLVPVEQRRLGLTITFCDKDGDWVVYQFKGGSINQWSSLNYWGSALEYYPDEEDITEVRGNNKSILKFKDKPYNPDEFSGMGKIILRKNLIKTDIYSADDKEHFINVLTPDMMREKNTIYIIQYDFDLNGKVITVPEDCILWFQGGTINNGTIYLQETSVLGALKYEDMGSAKIFGAFRKGQLMVFANDKYKAKVGNYFTLSERPSSYEEDTAPETEVTYVTNDTAYTYKTRQELKWWNGEKWETILDMTDYNEIISRIGDLIEKVNAEMVACYSYFKWRCTNIETDVAKILQPTDEEGNIQIVRSITVNGVKYTPDKDGNITLPDTNVASKVANKLIFEGLVAAQYDGSEEVTISLPVEGIPDKDK